MKIFNKGFNFGQDGPGNRLVYHLQGCNMRCIWCSNPEGMPQNGGKEYTVDEIFDECKRSKMMFFSGGGVTFTGGEATMQHTELFRNCTGSKVFFPVQGNHDGYCDLTKEYSPNMSVDEDWYAAISFVRNYKNVHIIENKPYYYVDFPERKLRIIILCTFFYEGFYDGKNYEKVYGTDLKQIEWLSEKALVVDASWKVLIFSHDAPTESFDEKALIDNPRVNGTLLFNTVAEKVKEYGFTLPAWFVGHFHGDYIGKIEGVNFVLIGSQTAYVPQLWDMPQGGYYPERILNSCSEDLWDVVVLDEAAHKIRLFRFGAGEDREIEY